MGAAISMVATYLWKLEEVIARLLEVPVAGRLIATASVTIVEVAATYSQVATRLIAETTRLQTPEGATAGILEAQQQPQSY